MAEDKNMAMTSAGMSGSQAPKSISEQFRALGACEDMVIRNIFLSAACPALFSVARKIDQALAAAGLPALVRPFGE